MTSIALGMFIVFIIYIMIWSIKNDGARSISEQTGLIRMRDPSSARRKFGRRSDPRRTRTAAANGRANKDR